MGKSVNFFRVMLCADSDGGQPEVPEAAGTARSLPGARQHSRVRAQAGTRGRTDEELDATLVRLYVDPRWN